MANSVITNPMVLDTTGTIIAKGKPFIIRKIRYQGTSDDDDCLISDANGVAIWSGKIGDVSISGYNTESDFGDQGMPCNQGLVLTTIDHGSVYVYLV